MSDQKHVNKLALLLNALLALALLYTFLVGVNCLSGGIKGLGKGVMDAHLGADMNPILGLIVGVLATTLVQSSSVTTSLVVGLVGSGQIPVSSAVPMIMGANIGTTVTNTIASLAHSTRSGEFQRAFSAATCHDFFNFLAVAVLLPLELISRAVFGSGALESLAGVTAPLLGGLGGADYDSPLKAAFKAGSKFVKHGVELFGADEKVSSLLWAVAGFVIILASLSLLVKVMRGLVLDQIEGFINRVLGSGGVIGMGVGLVVTIMVQSSSITTSILVPMAGAGLVTLAQVFPITLGANIGTTITALLASMALDDASALAATQIALVHLFFNLIGILIWYVPSATRRLPLLLAEHLGALGARSRITAVLYVSGLFYGLPAALFFASRALHIG